MSPFMKYHWRLPPHKYDIIYMEKLWSQLYLVCVVLNLWNCFFFFFPPDLSELASVIFPRDNVHPPALWVGNHCGKGDPFWLQQKKEKIDHNQSKYGKAEMKWKITSLVCRFDLPAYNGTGFLSALETSVGTSEPGYMCVKGQELCSSPSQHCTWPLPWRRYGRLFWFIGCIQEGTA